MRQWLRPQVDDQGGHRAHDFPLHFRHDLTRWKDAQMTEQMRFA
jgi:hypothetical protein